MASSSRSLLWVGGAADLYQDPIPQLKNAADEFESRLIMQPNRLIEMGMHQRDGSVRSVAIFLVQDVHVPKKCDGHYAKAYEIAYDGAASHLTFAYPSSGSWALSWSRLRRDRGVGRKT